MDVLKHFSIPWKGLKDGLHQLQFEVDDQFFREFPNNEIDNGDFIVDLSLDKRPGVSELAFHIEGTSRMSCDRCMETIDLPISGDHRILLKYGEEEEDTSEEVMFIDPDTSQLSLARLIYEYILLSIPMIKTYACELEDPRPCNLTVLHKLEKNEAESQSENPIWDALKGINFEEN